MWILFLPNVWTQFGQRWHFFGTLQTSFLGSIKIMATLWVSKVEKKKHLKTHIPQNCGFHQVNPIQINKSLIPKSSTSTRKHTSINPPPFARTSPPKTHLLLHRWHRGRPRNLRLQRRLEAAWEGVAGGQMDLCCERYQEVVGQWVLQHFCVCVWIYVLLMYVCMYFFCLAIYLFNIYSLMCLYIIYIIYT